MSEEDGTQLTLEKMQKALERLKNRGLDEPPWYTPACYWNGHKIDDNGKRIKCVTCDKVLAMLID